MEQNNIKNELLNNLSIIKNVTFLDFPTLDIYSKQCYKVVVSEAFRDENNFSYIYFDVDKLSILNETYGKKFGDRALKNLLSIIKKTLPHDAILSRIAGDEFCIVLPNATKEIAQKIESQIHKSIANLATFVSGLTITSSNASSKVSSNIEYLEVITESACSKEKQLKKINQSNSNAPIHPYIGFDDKDENR